MIQLVVCLALGVFLGPFNSTMLVAGLGQITEFYNVPFAQVTWLIIIYLIIMAGVQPAAGKLGDLYGRKRFIAWGLWLTVLAAILVPVSTNFALMLTIRAIQAFGVSLIMPNAMAVVHSAITSEKKKNRAFGIIGAVLAAGATLGPPVGGFFIDLIGWQYMFLVNLPLCLPAIYLSCKYIPEAGPAKKQVLMSREPFCLLCHLLLSPWLSQCWDLPEQPPSSCLLDCFLSLLCFLSGGKGGSTTQ